MEHYRAVHDPRKVGHEVVDAEGTWVAGPWTKFNIARDMAKALNDAAKQLEPHPGQQPEKEHHG